MDVDVDGHPMVVDSLSPSLPSRQSAASHSAPPFSVSDALSLVPLLESLHINDETSSMDVDRLPTALSRLSSRIVQGEDTLMDVEFGNQAPLDTIMASPLNNHSCLPDFTPAGYIENGEGVICRQTASQEPPVVASSETSFPCPGLEPASHLQVASDPIYVPARPIYTSAPQPFRLEESPLVDSKSECEEVKELTQRFWDLNINDGPVSSFPESPSSEYTFDYFTLGELVDQSETTHLATLLDCTRSDLLALTNPEPEVPKEDTAWLVERLRDLGKRLVEKRASRQRSTKRRTGPGRFTPYMRSTTPVILIDEEEDYSHELPTSLDTEELLDTPQDISDSFSQSQTDSELDPISPSDLTIPLSESNSTCSTTPTEETCVSLASFSPCKSLSRLDSISSPTHPIILLDEFNSTILSPTTSTNGNVTQSPMEDEDPNPKIVSPTNDDPRFPGHYPIDEFELSDYSHPNLFSRLYPKHAPSLLRWAIELIFGW